MSREEHALEGAQAAASRGSFPLSFSPSRRPDSTCWAARAPASSAGGRTSGPWRIDRSNLSVSKKRHGTVLIIGLTDTTTGKVLEVEAQNVGGLGLKDLIGDIEGDQQ